jgi:hypothetical protein
MAPESSPTSTYQLSVEHTKVISSLAFYLRVTGSLISVMGLFFCSVARVFSLHALGGILMFIIGVLMIRAAGLFQQIGASESCDTLDLVEALTHLRNAHRLITGLLIVMLIVTIFLYYQ